MEELFKKIVVSTHMCKPYFARAMRVAARVLPGFRNIFHLTDKWVAIFRNQELLPPIETSWNGGDGIKLVLHVSLGVLRCGKCQPGGKEITPC